MPVQKYFERMKYIDYLISHKATGTLNNLSGKLQLSKRATIICLNEMKELGFLQYFMGKPNSFISLRQIIVALFDSCNLPLKLFNVPVAL